MEQLLEVATVAEEVAAAGETVGSVDLATVSQQLDQLIGWQMVQVGLLAVLFGCLLGIACAQAFGRLWR